MFYCLHGLEGKLEMTFHLDLFKASSFSMRLSSGVSLGGKFCQLIEQLSKFCDSSRVGLFLSFSKEKAFNQLKSDNKHHIIETPTKKKIKKN